MSSSDLAFMTEDSSFAALVGEEISLPIGQNNFKWHDFVKGKEGFLYGIPLRARRVVKFNPVDKSMEMIGPDLGENDGWSCGVLAKNGCIYCTPAHRRQSNMLKINTITGTVETIDLHLLTQGRSDAYRPTGAVG